MKLKAISTVIASILMLMIVIGLGGTTYLFISGTFTGRTATTFELIDSVSDTVTIRNSGTASITSIIATLDGNTANIAVVPNIQGLIGYWSFNEGSGSTTDDNSDNNNVGTLNAGPTGSNTVPAHMWDNGKFGKALEFDGSDDYVSAGQVLPIPRTSPFTMSAWVKINSNPTWKTIVGTDGSLAEIAVSVLNVYFGQNGGGGWWLGGGPIDTSSWFHIVGVYDGTFVSIYVNGVLKEGPSARTFTNNHGVTLMGRYSLTGGEWMYGTTDEVALFNRALSQSEIQQLYSGLVSPGQLATVKPLTSLTKGTHTLRLCTSSMCNTAFLTIN